LNRLQFFFVFQKEVNSSFYKHRATDRWYPTH